MTVPERSATRHGNPCAGVTETMKRRENATPNWQTINKTQVMVARCDVGKQSTTTIKELGKATAAPTPNRNRVISSSEQLATAPVSAMNYDHHITIRVNTSRGP